MLNFLSFASAIFLLLVSSYWIASIKPLSNPIDFLLEVYLIAFSQIVIISIILSEMRLLTFRGFIISHLALFCAALPLWLRFKEKFNFGIQIPSGKEIFSSIKQHKILTLLLISAIVTVLVGAFLIIYMPPTNGDAMRYHLARAAYWMQNHTLRHFYTHNIQQTVYPVNAELLYLWTMIFLKSGRLAGFVQWTAYVGMLPLIYRLAVIHNYTKTQALFSAVVFSALPIIILQSTIPKNDMLVAFLVLLGFYLLKSGISKNSARYLIFSGIALGLALGTKPIALLALPGLFITAAIYFFSGGSKSPVRESAVWLLAIIVGTAVLAGYNYGLNFIEYNLILGPPAGEVAHTGRMQNFLANIFLIGYKFINFAGMPGGGFIALPGKYLFYIWQKLQNLFPNAPKEQLEYYLPYLTKLDEGATYFGPLGFLVFCPSIIGYLLVYPITKKHMERWILSLFAVSYFLGGCYLLKYQPFLGRFFILSIAVGAPLIGFLYSEDIKKGKGWITCFIAAISLMSAIKCSFYNTAKRILPLDDTYCILTLDNKLLQYAAFPEYYVPYEVDKLIPQNTRLGVILSAGDDGDYPLFGNNLTRKIVPVPPGDFLKAFTKYGIDYLMVNPIKLDDNIRGKLPTRNKIIGEYNEYNYYLFGSNDTLLGG